jgi:RNA polymerase sigma-70 factor (ECF subfamily)
VDGLPRRYRELVLLHYYADLALPEVAQALGKPLGTVKRQISEARALLATALEGAA